MSKTKQRFMRRGITKVYWLERVQAPNKTLTRKELCPPIRTDITDAVSDVEGWALTNEAIETPDLASTFTSSIPGGDKADNSSLTFYEDRVSDEVELLLPKGNTGWIVFLRKGDVPGSRSMDVFPVQVASRSAQYSTGNEAAKFQVTFTITEPPALDAVVPPASRPHPDDHDHHHHHHDDDDDDVSVDVTVVNRTRVHAELEDD